MADSDSDWDAWAEGMIGADENESPESKSPARGAIAVAPPLSDDAWAAAMEDAAEYSCVKGEDDPVWRQAARMAGGYAVSSLDTLVQMEAVVNFLKAHSPLSDLALCTLTHVIFRGYKWYVLRNTEEIRGVAAMGDLDMPKDGQHIIIFALEDREGSFLFDSIYERRWSCLNAFVPRGIRIEIAKFLEAQGRALQYMHPCSLYILPTHVTLSQFQVGEQINEDVRLCWLTEADAPVVNDAWPYRSEDSLAIISGIIRTSPCVGARCCDGSLVCWAVTYHYGSLGMLHTVKSHQRRGLARAVVAALCGHLRVVRPEVLPFAHIVEDNDASRALFESMGFTAAGTGDWASFK